MSEIFKVARGAAMSALIMAKPDNLDASQETVRALAGAAYEIAEVMMAVDEEAAGRCPCCKAWPDEECAAGCTVGVA